MTKKILIIDDEEEICQIVKMYLEQLGEFSVLTAHNGLDGLDKVRRAMPDLVLLDISMPIMNGFKVLESLKASDTTHHIPVIMLTGAPDDEAVASLALKYGNDCLAKPFNIEELGNAVLSRA
ncbi:MAG: response regulator [Acidobacteriota bacterium]|jgi:DNA-binding response OmpR family regulator|nr:response regulator [Acidobacteriota bacterium]